MHAGPAYEKFDPILGKLNFFGSHVNQAARGGPIRAARFRFCFRDSGRFDLIWI